MVMRNSYTTVFRISVIYIFAAVSQYHKNNPDDDPQEDPAQVEQNDLAQEFSQYEQR